MLQWYAENWAETGSDDQAPAPKWTVCHLTRMMCKIFTDYWETNAKALGPSDLQGDAPSDVSRFGEKRLLKDIVEL